MAAGLSRGAGSRLKVGGGGDATLKGGEEGDREVAVRAAEVLRRAKVSCRVAEGTCLRLGGRVAEATEALRDLLFEVSLLGRFG